MRTVTASSCVVYGMARPREVAGEAPGAGDAVPRSYHRFTAPSMSTSARRSPSALSPEALSRSSHCCVSRRPWSPPNISALTACMTCSVRMPRTMASSALCEGS